MIKNFIFVLNRFRTSSILNILGLSVAFAVFSITAIQCLYDFSYNRNFRNAGDIYRFSYFSERFEKLSAGISIPLNHAIRDRFPEIKAACVLQNHSGVMFHTQANPETLFAQYLVNANEDFTEVFTPKILAGNPVTAFTEKNKAMLTADVAEIMFGKENPVGQVIFRDTVPYTVVAVCAPFPSNSSLKNGVYATVLGAVDYDKMSWYNYDGFFLLNSADVVPLQQKLEKEDFGENTTLSRVELIPVTGVHFRQDVDFHGDESTGNKATTLSLLAIGVVTLLIAFINFMNFSVAMIPSRVRGMNIKKIMGANHRLLRILTASEAPCFAFVSFLTGVFLIVLFQTTQLNEFFPADLSPDKNIGILTVIALTGMAVAVLFGIYPARKVTSFQPAMALSGSFAQSKQSIALRNVLITLQFFAAIVLICVAVFIKMQHDYMTGYSWGFQKENIVYLTVPSKAFAAKYESEIRQHPSVLDCTTSDALPGSIKQNWGLEVNQKEVALAVWIVRDDFLRFFGMEVVEGRDFVPDDNEKSRFICNQAFVKKYDLGDILSQKEDDDNFEFVGVVKDIHFESLRSEIRPMGFITQPVFFGKYGAPMYIKIAGGNTAQTIGFLKTSWEKLTENPFDLHFLNASLDSLYQSESNLARLISIFGIIAVIIAVMGIYGLIAFNSRYRAKEIAIRKVSGSTTLEIMLLLNRNMLIQLAVAFAVAVPVAYYTVYKWLQSFAYRIDIHWWVFLLGGFIVLLIALLTVSARSFRSATRNPTEALNAG